MDYAEFMYIAARMVGDGDPGMLHKDLGSRLAAVDLLCRTQEGGLHSRQAIAIIIREFQRDNPNAKLYGD